LSKTHLHLPKRLSRFRIMNNYWHLIVRRCGVGVCVFVFALPVLAATGGPEWLKKRYTTLASKLNDTAFAAPVYIESDDHDGMMRGEVFGILPGAFASFSATLRQLPAWCDLLTLHFNIKGCTYRTKSDAGVLTVYSGDKRYEDPREARHFPQEGCSVPAGVRGAAESRRSDARVGTRPVPASATRRVGRWILAGDLLERSERIGATARAVLFVDATKTERQVGNGNDLEALHDFRVRNVSTTLRYRLRGV
jgi:hypothetical protein